MNNKHMTAPTRNSLVRVWQSTGKPGTPLVCAWIPAGTAQTRPGATAFPSPEDGGLGLCA
jgi:hypothetical protein